MIKTTFFIQEGRYLHKYPVTLDIQEDRIYFVSSPFALKDEIKAFKGAKWHGFDTNPRKIWSIENCPRNAFQLKELMGEEVYEWWDQPLVDITDFSRPEYDKYGASVEEHQIDMIKRGLTYRYQIWAADMGLGKSLAAIELMERSGKENWWYCGPISALESVEEEIAKWNLRGVNLRRMTYEKLTSEMRYFYDDVVVPDGVIFDECDLLKNCTAKRSVAAQALADLIREKHGFEGFVILMGGTPTAKSPGDLWSQCEICWPGFLREGSKMAFDKRYGITAQGTDASGAQFTKLEGWNEEEVAKLPERYKGLMTVYRKHDWLDLPKKKFVVERCNPSNKVMRVAKSLTNIAPNAITALTWLRALSSGFQYRTEQSGTVKCEICDGKGSYDNPEPMTCPGCGGKKYVPNYERDTVLVDTPKDDIVRKWLDKTESQGRIVLTGSFQGSVDKLLEICKQRGWAVSCKDGRGWRVYDNMGNKVNSANAMEFWRRHEGKVAFVGNPASMGYGLTLTEANVMLFYDNSFRTVHRLQCMDRIHRLSMDLVKGATIVDIVHLPVDQLVLNTLNENKKLELLSLDVIEEAINEEPLLVEDAS